MTDPVVVHALGIFGISDNAGHKNAPIDLKFVADDANDRYPRARPLAFFKDFVPVDAAPLDFAAVNLAGLKRFEPHCLHLLRVGRIVKHGDVVGVQIERHRLIFGVEVLRDADRIFVYPLAERLVADALLFQAGNQASVGVATLKFFFEDVFGDEAPLRIRPAGVLDGRVHVHRKRIPHPANLDVLVECVVVAILGQDA